MMHPSETDLALYAGGDLGRWAGWRIGRHVSRCPRCEAEVAEFRTLPEELGSFQQDLPEHLDWDALAAEMKANIRLGVAAGQCVAPTWRERLGWRGVTAVAATACLVISGWFLPTPRGLFLRHAPPALSRAVVNRQPVLQAVPGGVALRDEKHIFALRHAANSDTIYTSEPDRLRARFVDSKTNQVTINIVYAP